MEDKEYLKERLSSAKKIEMYSFERMDLLIIAISGAGIYVILETLKYSLDHPLYNLCVLKIAGSAFCSSIILNFISQKTSQKGSEHEISSSSKELLFGEDKKTEIASHDAKTDMFFQLTGWFNNASVIFMGIGLVLLMSYFLITF